MEQIEQIVDAIETYDFLANVLVEKPNIPTARYRTSSLGNAIHDVVECSSAQSHNRICWLNTIFQTVS